MGVKITGTLELVGGEHGVSITEGLGCSLEELQRKNCIRKLSLHGDRGGKVKMVEGKPEESGVPEATTGSGF